MKRYLTFIGAAVIAASSFAGTVSAQNGVPVNADGSYVVANDDGVPIVSGRGDDVIYGDINTGGGSGEILGDPSAVYTPILPDRDSLMTMPGSGDGLIGGVPVQPAAPDATTNTTTDLANNEGSTTENVPIDTLGSSEPAPVTTDTATTATDSSTTAATGFCSQYGTWYDAQVAYENLGATAADPALVQEIDPDYDGIACETGMA
jgi:hypothetical protein